LLVHTFSDRQKESLETAFYTEHPTAAVGRATILVKKSLRTPRHGVTTKTVAKWRTRSAIADLRKGTAPKSTLLSFERKAFVGSPAPPDIRRLLRVEPATLKEVRRKDEV
jgi:hypothetical protein